MAIKRKAAAEGGEPDKGSEGETGAGSSEPAPSAGKKYEVYDKAGGLVRTYTPDEHGKDAKKLAEEYSKKIGGTVQ